VTLLHPLLRLVRRYWAELFAAAGLVALIVGVNPFKLGNAFSHISWLLALGMVPVVIALYLCRGTAWYYALRGIGEHVGFAQTQTIELAGQVMIVLPMGDLARVAMVHDTDREHGVGALTATVALQELLYMWMVSLGALPGLAERHDVALFMLVSTLAFAVIFAAILWEPLYERAIRIVEHVSFLRRFDQQLHEIRPAFVTLCSPRRIVPILVYQGLAALLSFLLFYLALLAVGVSHVSYITAVFVLGVSYTFAAISFLPLGIGAFEGLPLTTMFLPGCCLSVAISSATLPLIRVEFCHSACCRVVETTTLGVAFIWSAIPPLCPAKAPANVWYVTRPNSIVSDAANCDPMC
jgi:hypothetical protein